MVLTTRSTLGYDLNFSWRHQMLSLPTYDSCKCSGDDAVCFMPVGKHFCWRVAEICWQTAISQSALADETRHSFYLHFYPTVKNNFLWWTLAHRRSETGRPRVREGKHSGQLVKHAGHRHILANMSEQVRTGQRTGQSFSRRHSVAANFLSSDW